MKGFIASTASGSRHLVDLEAMTYSRINDERELREQGAQLRVLEVGKPQVGACLLLLLEPLDASAVATVRQTSPVTALTYL